MLHDNTSIPLLCIKGYNRRANVELCRSNPETLGNAIHIAKPNHVIQINHGKVRTHASCEITQL